MKTIRQRRGNLKIVGFQTWFASYGLNAKGDYRIEVLWDLGVFDDKRFKIYQSKKKPLFRNLYVITALFLPICPLIISLIYPLSWLIYYIEGAKNFIRDSAWCDGVRFFNWVNIALIFGLAICLFLK